MSRWLMLSLGLGIAAAALYALLTGPLPGPAATTATTAKTASKSAVDRPSPREEIDSGSRKELREILRQADQEEGDAR